MPAQVILEQLAAHGLRRLKPDETWNGYQVAFRDLRPLKLNLGAFVPFLSRPGADAAGGPGWDEVLEDLVRFSREKAPASITVFVSDGICPPHVAESALLEQHSIAILDRSAVSKLLAGREQHQRYLTLARCLTRGVGSAHLSPYIPGKPASGGRFFGRTRLLEKIVSGKTIRNSTLVGNRRIGKTSLMHEARERLSEIYSAGKSIYFADLYGAKLKSTWDAVYLVCSQLDVNVPKQYMKLGAISERYMLRFPKLLHKFAKERDAVVVIFIDEFDSFLELDSRNDYQFLHLLRETAMAEANCYAILAGFRRLMETRVRQESPYFNFTDEIPVTPLTKDETLEMVNVPLERLGMDVAGTHIPELIYKETRGQPELIQMYCRAVVELVKRPDAIPKETDLQNYVHRNPAFNRTILHTFLKNTNPYEQMISLRLMQDAIAKDQIINYIFTVKNVDELRAQLGLPLSNAQSATLLNNLVVGSIVERVTGAPGKYRFAVPQLLRFCKDLDVQNLLAAAEAEAQRTPPTIHTLNMDTTEEPEAQWAGA